MCIYREEIVVRTPAIEMWLNVIQVMCMYKVCVYIEYKKGQGNEGMW